MATLNVSATSCAERGEERAAQQQEPQERHGHLQHRGCRRCPAEAESGSDEGASPLPPPLFSGLCSLAESGVGAGRSDGREDGSLELPPAGRGAAAGGLPRGDAARAAPHSSTKATQEILAPALYPSCSCGIGSTFGPRTAAPAIWPGCRGARGGYHLAISAYDCAGLQHRSMCAERQTRPRVVCLASPPPPASPRLGAADAPPASSLGRPGHGSHDSAEESCRYRCVSDVVTGCWGEEGGTGPPRPRWMKCANPLDGVRSRPRRVEGSRGDGLAADTPPKGHTSAARPVFDVKGLTPEFAK